MYVHLLSNNGKHIIFGEFYQFIKLISNPSRKSDIDFEG